MLKRLAKDTAAATAVEYGLIVALVALGCTAALQASGNSLSGVMTTATTAMAGQ